MAGKPGDLGVRLVVYWAECGLESRRHLVRWAEYAFAPMEEHGHYTPRGWRRYREKSIAVALDVPIGSKVVRRECQAGSGAWEDRMSVYWDAFGLGAETVASLAQFKQRGFKIAEDQDMAKRRGDNLDQIYMPFGKTIEEIAEAMESITMDDIAEVLQPFIEPIKPPIAESSAEVMAGKLRQLERLETAVRRAIEAMTEPMPQTLTALRILRECLIPEMQETIDPEQHEANH